MSDPQAVPLVLSAEDVRALALALSPAFRAAGLAVVPVEPTVEMLTAGTEEWLTVRATEDRAAVIWRAMLDLVAWPPNAKGMDPASRAALFRAELERRRERARRALDEALAASYPLKEERP